MQKFVSGALTRACSLQLPELLRCNIPCLAPLPSTCSIPHIVSDFDSLQHIHRNGLPSVSSNSLHTAAQSAGGLGAFAHQQPAPASAVQGFVRWSGSRSDSRDRHHRVNEQIFNRSLRVIFPDGKSQVMSRLEALKSAAVLNLDLVEFKGTEAKPAVAKILKYSALRRQAQQERQRTVKQAKESKEKAAAASAPAGKVKEVFFSPKISAHDTDVKMKKIRQWIKAGHRVSISREIDSTDSADAAKRALSALVAKLDDVAVQAQGMHSTPRMVTAVVKPKVAK